MKNHIKTTQELLDQGFSLNSIHQQIKDRSLVRICKGAYIDAGTWDSLYPSDKHLTHAEALRRKGNYVFTHSTAALILGMPVLNVPKAVHLFDPSNSHSEILGAQKHYYKLAPETVQYAEFTVTAPAQTVVDCAKTMTLSEALCTIDGALHRGLVVVDDARHALLAATGRGVRQCRRVAELMSPFAESPGETLTRLELVNAGISFTEQAWIRTAEGNFRADFAIDGYMILVEFDGDIKYRDDASGSILAERKRERALQNLGWTVIRVDWQQVRTPGRVAQLVGDAMRRLR